MWVDRVHQSKPPKQIILDIDSSVSPTCGNQEGSAYNGYFEFKYALKWTRLKANHRLRCVEKWPK